MPRITATKHQISVSADYSHGVGDVALPSAFGFNVLDNTIEPAVTKADRDSDYLGGSLSYSFDQRWYLDLSYANGDSTGQSEVPFLRQGPTQPVPVSDFKITDDWYQVYVRYAFPRLQGKRVFAYLRAGVSYVTTDTRSQLEQTGATYSMENDSNDILGSIGFGVGYRFWTTPKVKLGVQFEGEGSYGSRSQDFQERLSTYGTQPPSVSLDNTVFGGITRLTARFEYNFTRSGLLKLFVDGGIQARYNNVTYEEVGTSTFSGRSFDEWLWGPYAKLGLIYSF